MSKAGTIPVVCQKSATPHLRILPLAIGPPCTPLYSFSASVGQSIRPIIGLSGLCLL